MSDTEFATVEAIKITVDHLFHKIEGALVGSFTRWQDDKAYEDINDYAVLCKGDIEAAGLTFVRMTRRPFGCIAEYHGWEVQFSVTSKKYSWSAKRSSEQTAARIKNPMPPREKSTPELVKRRVDALGQRLVPWLASAGVCEGEKAWKDLVGQIEKHCDDADFFLRDVTAKPPSVICEVEDFVITFRIGGYHVVQETLVLKVRDGDKFPVASLAGALGTWKRMRVHVPDLRDAAVFDLNRVQLARITEAGRLLDVAGAEIRL